MSDPVKVNDVSKATPELKADIEAQYSEPPMVQIDLRSNQAGTGQTTIAAVVVQALEQFGLTDITVKSTTDEFPTVMDQLDTTTIDDLPSRPAIVVNDSDQRLNHG